jgi:hypothetical protein
MEIEMTGGKFTWSNNQPNPTLEKLDRYLMSKQWEDIFPSVKINKLPREVSDHNLLILMTDIQIPLRHLGFRFELIWIKNPIFNKKVKKSGMNLAMLIQSKLKKFKQYFKGWEFSRQGETKKQEKTLHCELRKLELIEENGLLSLEQIHNRTTWLSELMNILEEEELYWFKRAHEKWLHDGDGNTEYFHRIANGRRRENTIFSLESDGKVISGDRELLQHATEY